MQTQLSEIERIVDDALAKMEQLRAERTQSLGKIKEYEDIIREKDLELIRLKKEQQRLLETRERDSMHLLKEKGQAEQKIQSLLERFEQISKTGLSTEG